MFHKLIRTISLAILPVTMLAGLPMLAIAAPPPQDYSSGAIFTPNIQGLTDSDLGIQYGAGTGLANADPRLVAARIIRASMQILGILALGIVLFAGFTWMTAGGNEEKVGEAKKWLSAGIIGLAIILSAYAIVSFVISNLVTATAG